MMVDVAYGSSTDPNLPPVDLPTLGLPQQIPNIVVGRRQRVAQSAASDFPEIVQDRLPGAPTGKSASEDFPETEKQPPPARELTTTWPQRQQIDFMNMQAAAGQRTTPLIEEHQKNLLGKAEGGEADNPGYRDANGQFQPFDSSQHVILTDPADNTPKVYQRSPETDRGALGSTGVLFGTMSGPGPVMVSKAAPAITAAQRLGIDVPRAITSGSPLQKLIGQFSKQYPGGGPLIEGITNAISAMKGKVQEIAGMAGQTGERQAGEAFSGAVEDAFKPRTGRVAQGVSQAYDNVNNLLTNVNQTHQLPETVNEAQTILNNRASGRIQGSSEAVNQVMDAITDPAGLTYDGIKRLRTHIGRMIDGAVKVTEGTSTDDLNTIYRSLSNDLRNAVQAGGGPDALNAFDRANALAERSAQWRQGLNDIIGKKRKAGEDIYDAVVNMATKGGSDERGLIRARAAVPADVWGDIAGTAISKLGYNRAGEWTPAQFLSQYNNLTPMGRRILFAGAGKGQIIPMLSDLANISQAFKDAGKLANVSGTAPHTALTDAIKSISLGAAGAATPGVGPKALVYPAAVIGTMVGNNRLAAILAKPATLSSLNRWARVYGTVAANPTAAGLSALVRAAGELTDTINSEFGTNYTARDVLANSVGQEGQNPQ
jgi:hypothetical protein